MNDAVSETAAPTDLLAVNTIRTLAIDAIQQANSGHPGAPMGLAPVAYVLWKDFLKFNPKNPDWFNRDRFILSGGHASMLLYSMLHLTGYDVSLEDIKNFRQLDSKTPGHPEYRHTPGVETTTGPLGQGFANAVGMAMAERHLAARFNQPDFTIVDHHTYVLCGDGDLMEGVCYEAASLAGHLGLGKLIVLYDDNKISIEGGTDIAFTEDVALRFIGFNWHVERVADGNNLRSIRRAIENARHETTRPSLIMVSTHIAYGSPNKQDSCDAHGAPLGEEEVRLTKINLGCPENEFFCVPPDVAFLTERYIEKGNAAQKDWEDRLEAYRRAYPEAAKQLDNALNRVLPDGWDRKLPDFSDAGNIATRAASGKVLNALAEKVPELMGGSADLAPSNKTYLGFSKDFQKRAYKERNIRFGVREHAMGAILSGMTLHGGIRPYGGTFLVFADYMRPSIRLACLMKLPVIYVFTHDSIAVGEDGPTHQPVEHLASLRCIPGLTVIRPADGYETIEAWKTALKTDDGPVALILSRQKLPLLSQTKNTAAEGLPKGGYVLADAGEKPDMILIATGSEVPLAVNAGAELAESGISARIVSMPSWELFEKMSPEYKKEVLPPDVTARIAVEAGSPMGWERYVGIDGTVIAIDHFGASAPGGVLMEKFGFTVDNIVQKAKTLLKS